MDPRQPDHTRQTLENPEGTYPYPPELDDWKAAHHFGFDEYWNHARPGRRAVWLRRLAVIEETYERINYEISKEITGATADADDDDIGGAKRVYDKDQGGFLEKTPAMSSAQTPIEEFASFANTKKPTMTASDLRQAARQLLKEQGAQE